uniref:Uncharacterized protein n=1 Tax=Anguilla anguilla TaxID=7936 RepID=A0A0E9W200_ANGAN
MLSHSLSQLFHLSSNVFLTAVILLLNYSHF